ncbi:hypothetical protein F4809DRAFT_647024 [Biscogniauxia mediterranea]|nr:hypothetical protein F4809DRAFT_647024 [Biscogniauxia mediterranea]
MPTYVQSVKGATATLSGVYMRPSILSRLFLIILSGGLITRLGYYLPWAASAGAGTAVASGLISIWSPYTDTGRWIGYQILYGARGCGVQPVVIAFQHALPPSQSAVGGGFLGVLSELPGGSLRCRGQHDFYGNAGAGDCGVCTLRGSSCGIGGGWYLVQQLYVMVAAAASVSSIASWGMGWVDVRKKKQPASGEA